MLPLSADDWQRLEAVFHAASQMERSVRGAYLDAECAGDETFRRTIENLLAADDEPDHMMEEVIGCEATEMADTASGERLGHYEIVRDLGHGGMGTVYLAVRADDQFRKQVAIKLMRTDRMSRSKLERFRIERQILANLEHPGVARLLDGGTTSLGSPYVVMEYVDGLPVDVYCDKLQLGLRERIELFCRISAAVSYAHRNLIVHRDIKPENVLITGDGDPKLLDFGIAKLLKPDEKTPGTDNLTISAERLMTPEYASPEQARGDVITTLSDVYSLGVLLYKMLTERVPLRITSTRSAEIEREICTALPQPPSVVAGGSSAWQKLNRESMHDLDTIVMVALHKDPARRYASVENLSADLERFLAGFPVLARGDSMGYRAGKLIRRHPIATASLLSVLALMVVFAVAMTVLAKRAREEARTANEVTNFLISVFQANDPSSGRGDQVTARELLDRGAHQLDTRLKEDPAVQARLYDTMGALYNDLGSPQKAEELLQRSLQVRRERLSMKDEAAAGTLGNLGDATLDLSRFSDAEQYYREALDIHLKTTGKNSTQAAQDFARLSSALWDMGRFPEAETLDRQAIAMQTKLAGEDDLVTLDIQNDLGTIFQSEGRYAEAAAQLRMVLDRRLRIEPANHPDLGYSWHNYSQALASLGQYGEAIGAERRALAVRRAAYGEDHPQVALSEEELAGLLVKVAQFEEALQLARKAFDLELKTYGLESRDTSFCLVNYARALLGVGEGTQARARAQQAVDVRRKVFPAGHPKTADALEALAEVDLALGNLPLAEQEAREEVAMKISSQGAKHVSVGSAERELAEVLRRERQFDEAGKLAADALAIEQSGYPKGHPEVGLAEETIGLIQLDEEQVAAALPQLRDAYERIRAAYGPSHPQTASAAMRLAQAMAANGNPQAAMQLEAQAAPALLQSKDLMFHEERTLVARVQRIGSKALL